MSDLTVSDFFDWLRDQQDNDRLTQPIVDGANELLAFIEPSDLQKSIAKLNGWHVSKTGMTLSKNGSDMIKRYEKFMSKPYLDAVGVWTIGYGNTYYPNRERVKKSDTPLTEAQAAKLKQDIINLDFAPAVNLLFADEITNGKINQNQFDALISLAYNIGTKGLAGSSVSRYIKQGDMQRAADNFLSWNKGRVRGELIVLNGLTRRRNEERSLFLS